MPRGGKRPGAGAPKGNRNAVGGKGNPGALGGKRPGAGAPKGNLNALKTRQLKLSRHYQKHPGRGHPGAPRPGAPKGNQNAVKPRQLRACGS